MVAQPVDDTAPPPTLVDDIFTAAQAALDQGWSERHWERITTMARLDAEVRRDRTERNDGKEDVMLWR